MISFEIYLSLSYTQTRLTPPVASLSSVLQGGSEWRTDKCACSTSSLRVLGIGLRYLTYFLPISAYIQNDNELFLFCYSSPTVSAGAYGPSGFIRVNGNPLDGQVVNDPSSCKPLPSSSPYPSLHGHGCSATTNRELQCILKELKFITNRMKLNDEVSITISFFSTAVPKSCAIL